MTNFNNFFIQKKVFEEKNKIVPAFLNVIF